MTFIRNERALVGVWAILVAVSLAIIFLVGPNLGLDFTGGTLLERGIAGDVSAGEIRTTLGAGTDIDFSGAVIQRLSSDQDDESLILIRTGELTNAQIGQIDRVLEESFGTVESRRTQVVGPVIGSELIRNAILALVLSAAAMVVYLSLRFEYRFGLAVLWGVVHDVLVVVAALCLLRTEINTAFVAAILTVAGYSLNNTIIIFDRVRENLAFRKKEPLLELVNTSIRQTLGRTINTTITTLCALIALLIFGGSTIQDFIVTLLIGVSIGTISSLFFSPSIWLIMQREKASANIKAQAH